MYNNEKIYIELLEGTKNPFEAENVLQKISKNLTERSQAFLKQIESICEYRQFHLGLKELDLEANIHVGDEVFWGQDAIDGCLNTDGYYAGYKLGYGKVIIVEKDSICIDTYGTVKEEELEFSIFTGIHMLYMYLNAEDIGIFDLDGRVLAPSFMSGFIDDFPEKLKKEISNNCIMSDPKWRELILS